jgi:ubiquitin carboxyl-terminal hydrolase 5/13
MKLVTSHDWQPKKIEVKIDMPEEITLDRFKATGPQDGENLVPADVEMSDAPAPAAPAIDEAALSQLMDMGFNMNGCKRALMAVGGSNVEAAMNWVFEHNMDPDFNDPVPEGAAAAPTSSSDVDEGVVMSLVENLGCFTVDQVRAAVKHCNGAADRAADWLFSHMDNLDGAIAALQSSSAPSGGTSAPTVPLEDGEGKYTLVGLVSHIGKNTGSGHYVAHLKKDGKWVIFNDEKVALSQDPPIEHAYLYLFVRNDAVGSPHPEY